MEISYPDGKVDNLFMGNSFGITPTLDKQYMHGVVRTKVDDCQVSLSLVMFSCFFFFFFLIFLFYIGVKGII